MNEIVDLPSKRKKARHNRALTVASCVMFFFSAMIPCSLGFPGITVTMWAALLSYIIYINVK